jgi:hypothetical protein
LYALHRWKQSLLSFARHTRMLAFLPFILQTLRVIPPPQRKQVIGRFILIFLQCLQYSSVPCLFFPHPSMSQSLDSFRSLQHSEQFADAPSFRVSSRETPHPQLVGL